MPLAAPPRVSRALSLTFSGRSELSLDPDLRVYLRDLVRPYSLDLREDLLAEGVGHSYGEMGEELIRQLVPEDEPVDLLVVAYVIPDIRPGRSTALYLSSVCPGEPMGFGICDQGSAAAFTALRLIQEYLRAGEYQRALLMVVEQSTLHYEPALTPVVIPEVHAAAAIVCDPSGFGELVGLRQLTKIEPASAGAGFAAALSELAGDRADVTLVIGSGLVDARFEAAAGTDVLIARAAQPFTGIWSEFARMLPKWQAEGRYVVVADYEPALGYLCVAGFDVA